MRATGSDLLQRTKSAASNWFEPADEPRVSGWRGYTPEIILAAVLILLAGYVLLLRPGPSTVAEEQLRPPLGWIQSLRITTISNTLSWALLLPIGLAALLTFAAARVKTQDLLRIAVLGLAILLGVEGQLALANGQTAVGSILYLALGVVVWRWWVWFGDDHQDEWWQESLPQNIEIALFCSIFILSAFVRLFVLGAHPYGIEGDESKWTIEVVRWMLNQQHILSSEYHYTSLPVSFYMQAPFYHLFGPGILAGRLTVAVASIAAGALFYFLLRRTAGMKVALLGFFSWQSRPRT